MSLVLERREMLYSKMILLARAIAQDWGHVGLGVKLGVGLIRPFLLVKTMKKLSYRIVQLIFMGFIAGCSSQAYDNAVYSEEKRDVQEINKDIGVLKLSNEPRRLYPTRLYRRGVEGWVFACFDLDASGAPVNIKALEYFPDKAFVGMAVKFLESSVYKLPCENGSCSVVENYCTYINFDMKRERE